VQNHGHEELAVAQPPLSRQALVDPPNGSGPEPGLPLEGAAMSRLECPKCDEGVVISYRVNATAETIQVCNECDSVWDERDALPGPATTTVECFLAARGLPLLRKELRALA